MTSTRTVILLCIGAAASCALPAYSVGDPDPSTGTGGADAIAASSGQGGSQAGSGGDGGCPPPCIAMCGDGTAVRGELCLVPGERSAVATGPVALAVGDLDGDEILDIVAASDKDNAVTPLRGNGDGTFLIQQLVNVGDGITSLALADIDGDRMLDIAVGYGSGLYVLKNRSTPGSIAFDMGTAVIIPPVLAVTATDFTGNGLHDFAAASSDNIVRVLTSVNGSLNVSSAFPLAGMAVAIASNDLDNNGLYDLAAVDINGTVSLILQQPMSTGVLLPVMTGEHDPAAMALAELGATTEGGTAGIDILIANRGDNTLSLLRNDGRGTFVTAESISAPTTPSGLVAIDLNGDGAVDAAVSGNAAGAVTILLGGPDGFTEGPSFGDYDMPTALASGDFNGDRVPDLVVTEPELSQVAVLLSNP